MSKSQIAPDGAWIEWSGGECPVDGKLIVEARLLGHDDTMQHSAGYFDWGIRQMEGDIIAYRVVDVRA